MHKEKKIESEFLVRVPSWAVFVAMQNRAQDEMMLRLQLTISNHHVSSVCH